MMCSYSIHILNIVEAFQEVVSVNSLPYFQLFQSKKLAILPTSISNSSPVTISHYIAILLCTYKVTTRMTTQNHLVTPPNTTLQQGQQYPFIFSTSPIICKLIFLQKFISLRTVAIATSCGVVTITAPSGLALVSIFTTDKCSSEVPGGVSKELQSRS